MDSYIVFFVGLAWMIFATIQDVKTREVSNWLTFSLIAFGVAFSIFHSLSIGKINPFLFSFAGGVFYFCVAFALYYARVFAGGDAKLLMGVGFILPYSSWLNVLFLSLGFLFVLFFVGAIYSLIYSFFIAYNKRREFVPAFLKELKISKWLFLFSLVLIAFLFTQGTNKSIFLGGILIFFIPLLYAYLMALDKSCMIRLVHPRELSEGDWLEKDVKVGKKIIRASVHGVSKEEIRALRKANKKVFIKEGIPFVPAFLIAYLITGFFVVVLKPDLASFVALLNCF